jgi:hypothetical protein
MSKPTSARDKFVSPEDRALLKEIEEIEKSTKEKKAMNARLDRNERARELYAAKKAGKKLCSVKWLKTVDLVSYTAPSVFDLVSTPLAAYCHNHMVPQEKVPRLMHTGGNAQTGSCVCVNCNKGLTWRPCCKICNFQYFY